jgi:hypothetical protein
MPTYDFINTNTGEEWEEFMSIADMESLLEGNPEIKTAWKTAPAIAGDHIMGVGPKTDGGFEERMSQIANAHPGSPLASRYKSKESHAKIKARSIIDKHKKKRPFVS